MSMAPQSLSSGRLVAFRENFMPFEALLFYADAGNGDQFAFGDRSIAPRGCVRLEPRGRQQDVDRAGPSTLSRVVVRRPYHDVVPFLPIHRAEVHAKRDPGAILPSYRAIKSVREKFIAVLA